MFDQNSSCNVANEMEKLQFKYKLVFSLIEIQI